MAITYNITNNAQTIAPGQTVSFTPQGSAPTSDNPAVTAITATSANGDDAAWQAFLTNGQTFEVQVTAPANAQNGDDLVVTINLAGFDGGGNNVDSGTGVVTFTVDDGGGGGGGGEDSCRPSTRVLGNATLSIDTSQFAGGDLTQFVSVNPPAGVAGAFTITNGGTTLDINSFAISGVFRVPITIGNATDTIRCDTYLDVIRLADAPECQNVTQQINTGNAQLSHTAFNDNATNRFSEILNVSATTAASGDAVVITGNPNNGTINFNGLQVGIHTYLVTLRDPNTQETCSVYATYTVGDPTVSSYQNGNGATDCVAVNRTIGAEAIQLFAGDFRDATSALYTQITALNNVTPATNSITFNNTGNGRIDVALTLPNGTYNADVQVQTDDGTFCNTTLTIVKDSANGFTCNTIAARTITFGTEARFPATIFNTAAVNYDTFNVTPNIGTHATIDASGAVDALVFDSTTPLGTYTVTQTVSNPDGGTCTRSYNLTVAALAGPNIVDCNTLEWVGDAPTIQCGFATSAQIKAMDVDGSALNVPVENVSVTTTAAGVETRVIANLGGGIYSVEIDASDASCTGDISGAIRVSAVA